MSLCLRCGYENDNPAWDICDACSKEESDLMKFESSRGN